MERAYKASNKNGICLKGWLKDNSNSFKKPIYSDNSINISVKKRKKEPKSTNLLFCFLLYSVTQSHDWKHVVCRNGGHLLHTIWFYYVNTDCLVQQEVQHPSDTEVQSLAAISHMWASSASSAQRHTKPWFSCFIMLIEVQSKAKKSKAFIRTGCQQDQELLDDSLNEKKRKNQETAQKATVVCFTQVF